MDSKYWKVYNIHDCIEWGGCVHENGEWWGCVHDNIEGLLW